MEKKDVSSSSLVIVGFGMFYAGVTQAHLIVVTLNMD